MPHANKGKIRMKNQVCIVAYEIKYLHEWFNGGQNMNRYLTKIVRQTITKIEFNGVVAAF